MNTASHTSHELQPLDALAYIMAGKGKATLIGKTHRYTYKFSRSETGIPKVFVNFLTGPNNEKDFVYLGFIPASGMFLTPGKKGNLDHPAAKAFSWYLSKLNHNTIVARQATFLHEGVCGLCGRTLTTPESIARGFGPECIKSL